MVSLGPSLDQGHIKIVLRSMVHVCPDDHQMVIKMLASELCCTYYIQQCPSRLSANPGKKRAFNRKPEPEHPRSKVNQAENRFLSQIWKVKFWPKDNFVKNSLVDTEGELEENPEQSPLLWLFQTFVPIILL